MLENRLLRAVIGLPILAPAWPMIQSFSLVESAAPWIEVFLEQSRYDLRNGGSVPLLKHFYGIAAVDQVLAGLTVAFSPLLFYDNPAFWWFALVFLTDVTALYAIIVLESRRSSNKYTLFQFGIIPLLAAQFMTIGIIGSVWFYLFWVFSPAGKNATANARRFDGAGVAALLPMLVTGYLVPYILNFFHPDFEARLWWNWVWQLYPIWGSTALFVYSNVLGLVLDNSIEIVQQRNKSIIRFTVGAIMALCTSIYWYTLASSGFSPMELFVPTQLTPFEDPIYGLHALFQHDYALSYMATILWLGYSYGELKAKGICTTPWATLLLIGAVVGIVGGPGTLIIFAWAAREETMEAADHEKSM